MLKTDLDLIEELLEANRVRIEEMHRLQRGSFAWLPWRMTKVERLLKESRAALDSCDRIWREAGIHV